MGGTSGVGRSGRGWKAWLGRVPGNAKHRLGVLLPSAFLFGLQLQARIERIPGSGERRASTNSHRGGLHTLCLNT